MENETARLTFWNHADARALIAANLAADAALHARRWPALAAFELTDLESPAEVEAFLSVYSQAEAYFSCRECGAFESCCCAVAEVA